MTKILITKRRHGCGYIQSIDFFGQYHISPDAGVVDLPPEECTCDEIISYLGDGRKYVYRFKKRKSKFINRRKEDGK